MIRQNESSEQPKQANGVYAFDLKLNVDFNSGHLTVNVPPPPFSKKISTPISNGVPSYNASNNMVPQYIPIHRKQSSLSFNNDGLNSRMLHVNHVQAMHDQSLNPQSKHSESLNTTTFRVQQPPSGVECVICQKVINQDAFSLHLQEHKNRRKTKQRSSLQESDLSIRNKNESAQVVQLINPNHPQSFSFIPHSLTLSHSSQHSNHSKPNSISQGVSNQSNTIIFPIMAQNHHSRAFYSKSDTFNNMVNHSSQSFAINNTTLHQQQIIQNTSLPSYSNQRSYISSQVISSSNPINMSPPYPQQINLAPNRMQAPNYNSLQFNRIQSMIIRQQSNKQEGLQQCGQSRISRNSLPTKYSQIYAMQKELQSRKPTHYQQQSSSDDESLKGYGHRSVRSIDEGKKERSNLSQKLLKTKLPVNYLARQEFITNSSHSSGSKSKATN